MRKIVGKLVNLYLSSKEGHSVIDLRLKAFVQWFDVYILTSSIIQKRKFLIDPE